MGNEVSGEGGMPPQGMPGQMGGPGGPNQGMIRPQSGGPMAMPPGMGLPQGSPRMVRPQAVVGFGPSSAPPGGFGGPAASPRMPVRPSGALAGPRPPALSPSPVGAPAPPEIDLSNLSEEERAKILSVMARAQDMDMDLEKPKLDEGPTRSVAPPASQKCPLCQATDLNLEAGCRCVDCGRVACQRCGAVVMQPDGKRPWICSECQRRFQQNQYNSPQQRHPNEYQESPSQQRRVQQQQQQRSQEDYRRHQEAPPDSYGQGYQQGDQRRGGDAQRRQQDQTHYSEQRQVQQEPRRQQEQESADQRQQYQQQQQRRQEQQDGRRKPEHEHQSEQQRRHQEKQQLEQRRQEHLQQVEYRREQEQQFQAEQQQQIQARRLEREHLQMQKQLQQQQSVDFSTNNRPNQAAAAAGGQQAVGWQSYQQGMAGPQPVENRGYESQRTPGQGPPRMGTGMVNGSQQQAKPLQGAASMQEKAPDRGRKEDSKTRVGQAPYPKPSQPRDAREQRPEQGPRAPASVQRQQVTSTSSSEPATSAAAASTGISASSLPTTTTLANGQVHKMQPRPSPQAFGAPQTAEVSVSVASSIPRTVPLTSVSQTLQQQPHTLTQSGTSAFDPPQKQQPSYQPDAYQAQAHVTVQQHQYQQDLQHAAEPAFQAPSQQAQQQHQVQQPVAIQQSPYAGEQADQKPPKSIELGQKQQQQQQQQPQQQRPKVKPEAQDWSPVSDLSPILDVSPSVEAAEQELMEKFREEEERLPVPAGIPRATSGTISGMLADFNKAMGLNSVSPGDEPRSENPAVVEPAPSSVPKRIHRRLPQPTMEQMQAAVAMAAQAPGLSPATTASQRPVSPMVHSAPVRKDVIVSSTSSTTDPIPIPVPRPVPAPRVLSAPTVVTPAVSSTVVTATVAAPGSSQTMQLMSHQAGKAPDELVLPRTTVGGTSPVPMTRTLTPVTPQTPGTQGGDSSDTLSEADSGKSGGKVRGKLPPLPQDQEPTPVPARRSKDRTRVLSAGALDRPARPKQQPPPRASSMDGATASIHTFSLATKAVEALSSVADRPERPASASSYLYLDALSGTKLPSYMNSLKQQLREELRTVTEERRRLLELRDRDRDLYRRSETDLASLLAGWQPESPLSRLGRRSSPIASPRRARHRRHMSDPRAVASYRGSVGAPFKSYEYEFIDRDSRGAPLQYDSALGRLYQRGVSLSDVRLGDSDGLRLGETAIGGSSFADRGDDLLGRYRRGLTGLRRSREGSLESLSCTARMMGAASDSGGRSSSAYFLTGERRPKRKDKMSRKPRSWHPSPYVSEDEDDTVNREERKAKIKAEIARRRQQIEENARLHDELYKLARLREGSDLGYPPQDDVYRGLPMVASAPSGGSSVLQAIDEILRKDYKQQQRQRHMTPYSGYYGNKPVSSLYATAPTVYSTATLPRYDYYGTSGGSSSATGRTGWFSGSSGEASGPSAAAGQSRFPDSGAEDKSIALIASTFPADDLSPDPLQLVDYSPFATDTEPEYEHTPAMPLLPDMPTRSRGLLEHLGSAPIVARPHSAGPAPRSISEKMYRDRLESERVTSRQHSLPLASERLAEQNAELLRQGRKAQSPSLHKTSQKYFFPVKRILLTRDPKDRSISGKYIGNGLGMKVVGGRVIPGSNGVLGAYVAKIYAGGVVETLGEVNEGDQVLEWNGIPLTGKTYEEVQRIIASSADEVEIVIRSDFNMLDPRGGGNVNGRQQQARRTPRLGVGSMTSASTGNRDSKAHLRSHSLNVTSSYDGGLDVSPDDLREHVQGREHNWRDPTPSMLRQQGGHLVRHHSPGASLGNS